MPFRSIFWLFGLFIFACGTTHLLGMLMSVWPAYRFDGLVKLITALASWGTVAALFSVVPRALLMRSPEELEREIDERRKAETRLVQVNMVLEERSKQLEEANSELMGFTYTVSHDLRTTLRGIVANSQILVHDAGESLDEESRERLQRLEVNALRMGEFIENLLEFTRVGKASLNQREVNLSAMAATIGEELQVRAKGALKIEPGLMVHGDPDMLYMVMANLLENAWKYVEPGQARVVEVGRTPEGEYFVRDQGIGFDMVYEPKVWEPFERLHPEGQYEGTGIGLANVKRIIQRHGGTIRVESKVGEGTTVYFRLIDGSGST